MKLFKIIKKLWASAVSRYRIAKAQRLAAEFVACVKAQYPGCEGAMNAWPTTGAGSLSTGVLATGVTTIRWGTKGLGQNTGWLTVLRFSQKTLTENIKLPNGDGVTSTRIQIVDGQQWDITVRDDTALVPPQVGDSITVVDAAGLIGGLAADAVKTYSATVVESGFDTAPKQAGERTVTVENLLLVDSQTSGSQT